MEFGFALDLVYVPLLGIVTVYGLYRAIRTLVRGERGFGRWLGRGYQLILLVIAVLGSYSCYNGSGEDLRRYEDFMSNGVQAEGTMISSVRNPWARGRRSRGFDNVILFRTEEGTPYYHTLRSRTRLDAQERVILRYKPENPREVLVLLYDTSAQSAWFRRVLSYILAGLAVVALVMLWSCSRGGGKV